MPAPFIGQFGIERYEGLYDSLMRMREQRQQRSAQMRMQREQLAAQTATQERQLDIEEEKVRVAKQAAQMKALAPKYEKVNIGEGRQALIKTDPITGEATPVFTAPEPPYSVGGDKFAYRILADGTVEPIWIPRMKLGPKERMVEQLMGTTLSESEELIQTPYHGIQLRGGVPVSRFDLVEIGDDEYVVPTPEGIYDVHKKETGAFVKQIIPVDIAKATPAEMLTAYARGEEVEVRLEEIRGTLDLKAEELGISAYDSGTRRLKVQGEITHFIRSDSLEENRDEWEKDIAHLRQKNDTFLAQIRQLEAENTATAMAEANVIKRKVAENDYELGMLTYKLAFSESEEVAKQRWYELGQGDKVIALDERLAGIEEQYKVGVLSLQGAELARRTNLDAATIALEKRKEDRLVADSKSINVWRRAQTATEKDRVKYMGSVLEFEKNKFSTTHEFNVDQTDILNKLLERAATREDKSLALEISVSNWTKTREDAYLSLAQLKEQNQDLQAWADIAETVKARVEHTRLTELIEANRMIIAEYEKEIKDVSAKLEQSKYDLLVWEKVQVVPARVREMEARTEEAFARAEAAMAPEFIKLGPRERGFMLRPGEEVPTAVPGMEAEAIEEKNIMAELMGKAMGAIKAPAGLELPEDMRLLGLDYFKAYVRADRRLTEPTKEYYIGIADTLAGKAPKLSDMLDPTKPTGIPWMPGSLTIEEFMREWDAADARRMGEVAPAAPPKKVPTAKKATPEQIKKFIDSYRRERPEATDDEVREAVRNRFGE